MRNPKQQQTVAKVDQRPVRAADGLGAELFFFQCTNKRVTICGANWKEELRKAAASNLLNGVLARAIAKAFVAAGRGLRHGRAKASEELLLDDPQVACPSSLKDFASGVRMLQDRIGPELFRPKRGGEAMRGALRSKTDEFTR